MLKNGAELRGHGQASLRGVRFSIAEFIGNFITTCQSIFEMIGGSPQPRILVFNPINLVDALSLSLSGL